MPLGIRQMIAGSSSLASITAALVAFPAVTTAQESHSISGSTVSVYNLAGRITVEPGAGPDVVVAMTRGGSDASQLQVETGQIDDANTFRVVYPTSRVVASFLQSEQHSKVRVRENGTFSDNGGSQGSKVTISGDGNGLEAWADLAIQVPAGKEVSIYLAVGRIDASNLNGDIRLDTHSAPVTATGISGSLDVDVGSGSVEVSDVSGYLRVDTGSGGVRVNGAEGPVIDIDTGSGSVTGGDLVAETIRIDTGSGGIDLERVAGDHLSMDTGSGSVQLTLTRAPSRIMVDTGSGGVTIRSPSGINAMIELETGSGSIETDFPITVTRHSRDHVKGQIGEGAGQIKIETGSGSIRLLRSEA